jgi:hypothetical protein
MPVAISNPEKILRLLDSKLAKPMELTIYGRAALALGFAHPKADFLSTKDVDAVIPICTLDAFRENDEFWNAQEEINKELEPHGLYMTHLFTDADVIIRPDWTEHRVPISMDFRNLRLYRPEDVNFLILQEPAVALQIPAVFDQAKVPDTPEIPSQFEKMKPKVVQIANRFKTQNQPPPFGDPE